MDEVFKKESFGPHIWYQTMFPQGLSMVQIDKIKYWKEYNTLELAKKMGYHPEFAFLGVWSDLSS